MGSNHLFLTGDCWYCRPSFKPGDICRSIRNRHDKNQILNIEGKRHINLIVQLNLHIYILRKIMSQILFGMSDKIVLFVKLLCFFSQMYAAQTKQKNIQWAVAVRILV